MHRDTWAGDTHIVSRPNYRIKYRDQCIAITDTYHDATSGASRYVNAACQRMYHIMSVHTTTGDDAALFAPCECAVTPKRM